MAAPCLVLALCGGALSPAFAIVGGKAVDVGDAPRTTVVRVESTRGELCTGTVLDRQVILTAAHCMLGGGRFSVVSLDSQLRARRHAVSRIIIHPTFVPGTTPRTQPGADLAMIRLAEPLPADLGAAAIGSGIWTGEGVTIVGYGLSAEHRRSSARTLRQAKLVAAGTYTSANSVTVAVDEEHLGQKSGAGACRGDSGGPAFRGDPSSGEIVGVVSWSSGPLATRERLVCGGFTSITSVADNKGWIRDTIAQLQAPPESGGFPASPLASAKGNAAIIER